jgi:hypothetical protein
MVLYVLTGWLERREREAIALPGYRWHRQLIVRKWTYAAMRPEETGLEP